MTLALASLDAVKAYLDKDNSTHDALLSMLIEGVSARMSLYMGRTIEATQYDDEVQETPGYPAIVLDHGPVIRVITLVEGSTTLTASDYRIENQSLIRLADSVTSSWSEGDVTVTYEAGYEDVPADLALACVMQVAREYDMTKAGQGVLGVSRDTANQDTGESRQYEMRPWLPQVEATMKAYRLLI